MSKLKKKENIIIIAILVVMLIAIIGVSYAAFSFGQAGNIPNTITTGDISMTYEEGDNTISLGNALPTTDATGTTRLKEGEYFDFTVSSNITGNVNINYEISTKEVGDGTIDGSNIKLYLTEIVDGEEQGLMTPETYNEETGENTYTGRPANEMSLYTSSMNSSEEHTFRLRMYVTEEYNPQGDGGGLTFTVQVNVYGKAGEKMPVTGPISDVVIENLSGGSTYDDGVDTFITGEDPNNYIWYSGKLWRVVSINNEAKTTKLVTQWNISAIPYNESGNTAFEGSHMEDWLNDTTVDGFLGNLREPDNFIITDAKWNTTKDENDLGSLTRPSDSGTVVTNAVGLLTAYEYQTASTGYLTENYWGDIISTGYLNNGLDWWTLTPSSSSFVYLVQNDGRAPSNPPVNASGARPSINLKSSIRIVDGDGTIDNPYRLNGDNDSDLSGILLSSRYSGEYIRFGNDENNLYRIVSHENGTETKITSAEPLKNTGTFITRVFGSNTTFSSGNTIGTFLNNDYLNTENGYLTDEDIAMIKDSTTWYLGTVGSGTSYKLAKYIDTNMSSTTSTVTNAKVGLLRLGELMAGQFEKNYANESFTGLTTTYLTLTPYSTSNVRFVSGAGIANYDNPTRAYGVRPSLNLKSNVIITGGAGTKNNPFEIALQ